MQIIFLKPSRLVLSLCIAQSLLYYGSLMILCWRLTLLDITLAFDAVAHKTLLSRLEYFVGIQGTDLSWFKSYLTNISLAFFLHCLLNFPVECPRARFSHPFFSLCIYFLQALFPESMVYHFTAMQMIPKCIYL